MGTYQSLTLRQVLQFSGIVLLCTTLVCYVVFQARNMLQGPTVALTEMPESPIPSKSILVSGTAHNIVKLTLNGKEIHTNKEGAFSEELILENGYTIATFWAQDRFGRTTTLSKPFVYKASAPIQASTTDAV